MENKIKLVNTIPAETSLHTTYEYQYNFDLVDIELSPYNFQFDIDTVIELLCERFKMDLEKQYKQKPMENMKLEINEKTKTIKIEQPATLQDFYKFAKENNFDYSEYTLQVTIKINEDTDPNKRILLKG